MCELSPKDLKDLFDTHAKEDNKVSKKTLVRLLSEKMGDDLKGAKDSIKMRTFLKDMDDDGDGKYNFEEFKNAFEKAMC